MRLVHYTIGLILTVLNIWTLFLEFQWTTWFVLTQIDASDVIVYWYCWAWLPALWFWRLAVAVEHVTCERYKQAKRELLFVLLPTVPFIILVLGHLVTTATGVQLIRRGFTPP
jgi:hypothetical protein